MMETDATIDSFLYPDNNGNLMPIPKGNAGMLKSFNKFVAHQTAQNIFYNDDTDWMSITRQQFNAF